jgi:hypothetical protein
MEISVTLRISWLLIYSSTLAVFSIR